MSQTVHLRAASSSFSHPHLYRVPRRPQVPASARPSPEVTLRKPLGVLLTLLESTLARVLASVDSKGLADMLNPLDATLTKNRGEGAASPHPYLSHLCLSQHFAGPRQRKPTSQRPEPASRPFTVEAGPTVAFSLLCFAAPRSVETRPRPYPSAVFACKPLLIGSELPHFPAPAALLFPIRAVLQAAG